MSELKRSGMDLPPPAKEEEFPKKKFGVNISIKPAELVKSNQAERQPAEAPLQTTSKQRASYTSGCNQG